MTNLHLHIVGLEADGSQCPLGRHIPGARVHVEGFLDSFCYRRFIADYISDGSGVVNFPVPNSCYNLSIGATTPKGKHSEMRQTGAFLFETDVTWALGVPGACDEGSAGADAGAWLGGFGGIVGTAVGIGFLALGVWAVVKIASNRPAREKIAAGGREIVRRARGR